MSLRHELEQRLQQALADYERPRIIDAGGTGIIFKAKHKPTQKPRAIKWNIDEEALKKGNIQETGISKNSTPPYEQPQLFEHPGLIRIYEHGRIDPAPYLIMDYIEEQSLETRITTPDSKQVTLRELEKTFIDIAEALHAIHAAGYIHREITLNNIQGGKLIDYDLMVKYPYMQDGNIFCASDYFTPDHVIADVLDQKTDVYMLATALYATLNKGTTPFARAFIARHPDSGSDGYIKCATAPTIFRDGIDTDLLSETIIAAPKKWNKLFKTAMALKQRPDLQEFYAQMKETFKAELKARQRKMYKWSTPTG